MSIEAVGQVTMWIVLSVVFLVMTVAYIRLCNRLKQSRDDLNSAQAQLHINVKKLALERDRVQSLESRLSSLKSRVRRMRKANRRHKREGRKAQ